MNLLWIFGILLCPPAGSPNEVVEPGPPTGIVLQGSPGLLITHCRLFTQRIYVCLDPWDVYRKHIRLPPQLTEGRLSGQLLPQTTQNTCVLHFCTWRVACARELFVNQIEIVVQGSLVVATRMCNGCVFYWACHFLKWNY